MLRQVARTIRAAFGCRVIVDWFECLACRRESGASARGGRSSCVVGAAVPAARAWRTTTGNGDARSHCTQTRGPGEELRGRHIRAAWSPGGGCAEPHAAAHRQTNRCCWNAEARVVIRDLTFPNASGNGARPGLPDRMYVTWPRPEGRDHEEAQTKDERRHEASGSEGKRHEK